jgi:hypothetical protein
MSALKKALVAAVATAAAMGGVALAAPAQAQYASVITSIVYWTGPDCISVRYSEGYTTNVAMKCGGYSERTYLAVPGQYVGADPMPLLSSPTTTLGCSLRIDGGVDNTDYAPPGDVHHNVDCMRVLVDNDPSYPSPPDWPSPPKYQPPPLLRAF